MPAAGANRAGLLAESGGIDANRDPFRPGIEQVRYKVGFNRKVKAIQIVLKKTALT